MLGLYLGGRYHTPMTARVTLVFVLGQGLNLATLSHL